MIKVGSDFSGVGAFNQALMRLGIDYEEVFACDWNKYSRQTFALNYGTENDIFLSKVDSLGKTTIKPTDYSFYFPKDVYEREIPKESLDIYMTSPPCQAFSLAGKRKGEEDDRGVLFYNSHEFITKNKPRYFIFENVKGLLSDDGGKTFQRWIDFLGGKSVNGNPVLFPLEEATPYHVYYQVLNAKNYGIPQNRERIFIIGVRDDADNDFSFPKPFYLVKRLKDVLESQVDEKYFLSDNNIKALMVYNERQIENNRGFSAKFREVETVEVMDALKCGGGGKDDLIQISKEVRTDESKLQRKLTGSNDFRGKKIEFIDSNVSNTITTSLTKDHYLKIHANTSKGYDTEEEEEEDLINFSVPNSETRRGRIGKGVSQTLDMQCNQGIATRQLSKQENEQYEKHTRKTLLMLQQEIGEKAVEAWGLRIMEVVCKKDLLQSGLYENRIYSKGEKIAIANNSEDKQKKSARFIANVVMRSLPKEGWKGCSSQGRKSIKQLIKQFDSGMQELSFNDTQSKANLQTGELSIKSEGIWILRQALSEIQEVWESINSETQPILRSQRIRRLTEKECFRLMDFPDSFMDKIQKHNLDFPKQRISGSQLYKQAGNSICVGVLAATISKLKL